MMMMIIIIIIIRLNKFGVMVWIGFIWFMIRTRNF